MPVTLNRPSIDVRGEVLSNLFESRQVDWIRQVTAESFSKTDLQDNDVSNRRITARGACDLGAVIHYFRATTSDAVGEYHIFRNGGTFRIDHSIFLRHAIHGLSADAFVAAERLGYIREDFTSRLFENVTGSQVVLLSFAADALHSLYLHRKTGLEVPFSINILHKTRNDLRLLANAELPFQNPSPWMIAALQYLRDEFDFVGLTQEDKFKDNLDLAIRNIPASSRIFILEFADAVYQADGTRLPASSHFVQLNQWVRDVCQGYANVEFINVSKMISHPSEMVDLLHYDRKVYFRIYQDLCSRMGSFVVDSPKTSSLQPALSGG